jgi:hypothetical protein
VRAGHLEVPARPAERHSHVNTDTLAITIVSIMPITVTQTTI